MTSYSSHQLLLTLLQGGENDSTQWSLASLASQDGHTKLLGLTSLVGTAAVAGGGFLGRLVFLHVIAQSRSRLHLISIFTQLGLEIKLYRSKSKRTSEEFGSSLDDLWPEDVLRLLSTAGTGFDTAGPLSVASALGVLAAIVTVHECGHFVAARLQNIHVTQFSIGFGPSLWSYKVPFWEPHSWQMKFLFLHYPCATSFSSQHACHCVIYICAKDQRQI